MARIFVVSGPSGVGKTTIVRAVAGRHADVFLSVSATTRPPREGEGDGVQYRFMTDADFTAAASRGEFLETALVHGHRYATPRRPLEEALAAGRDAILEIDVQGARAVKEAFPEAVMIFVEPPSWDALRSRLEGRGTEDPATVEARLLEALREVAVADLFDVLVANNDLGQAVEEVDRILKGRRGKE